MTSTTIDIAAINAMLEGTTIAPIAPPQPARKPARKAQARDWQSAPASIGQHRRITTIERGLGYRASTRRTLGTGADARNLWRSLVSEAIEAGYKVNRATGELS
jgi:hypothetical protein